VAWLRYSDGHNRQPEIHALDDGSYRALQCLIEAAENFDACGMAIDSYAVGFYPHARQKLRGKIGKLADRGLVHLLSGIGHRSISPRTMSIDACFACGKGCLPAGDAC